MNNLNRKTITLSAEEQSTIVEALVDLDLKGLDERITTAIRVVSCAFEFAAKGQSFSANVLRYRVNEIGLKDSAA